MKTLISPKLLVRALPGLVISAVPLAAFLAFSIQPLMGKRLLPMYGGTPGTWLGCMVFYQLALMLGYSWAAWLVRQRINFQVNATVLLALVAVVTFRLPTDEVAGTASIVHVVWRLAFATLPAMVLLFSTPPLLHGWMQRRGQEVPYYLYAISNAGSLLGLLVYPFWVESALRLSEQRFYWHSLLTVTAGLLAAAGFVLKQTADNPEVAPTPKAPEPVALGTIGMWLFLSALTCVGMLGATYHIVAEIGSTPLAWVGPFGLYLVSFIVTFSGIWRRWMTLTTIMFLAVFLSGFMVAKGFMPKTLDGSRLVWLLFLTGSGSFLGNALLHSLRPTQRFERYYLFLAAGGVLGGLLSSVVIPRLLSQPIEFELASVALLTTGMLWLSGRRDPGTVAVTTCVLFVPVLWLGFDQAGRTASGIRRVRHMRDFYGHLIIETGDHSVGLSSDTTSHGTQITTDASSRRRPTLYYTESTGIGRVLEKLQSERPTMNVGVVGLGAGTLAAYARQGDSYDFWDIDPKALYVAQNNFTYVADSPGQIHLHESDGRKALEESKTDYDVLLVDAFTGDGIPPHLFTREAMAAYFRRLMARNGLLVINTGTRYSKLFPVVEATVQSLGRSAINVITDISEPGAQRDFDPTHTDYTIVCRPEQMNSISAWFPAEEEKGRVKHQVGAGQNAQIDSQLIWSDDRNAMLDILDPGRLLVGP